MLFMAEDILEPSGAGGLLFIDFTLSCFQANGVINRFYTHLPLPFTLSLDTSSS